MAWTQTDQVNRALALIGSTKISSISSTTDPVAVMFNTIFDNALETVLIAAEWGFAIKRVELTQIPAWLTDTDYEVSDTVFTNGNVYTCAVAHTSDVFATDLASVYWTQTYTAPTFGFTVVYSKPSDYLKGLLVDDEDASWAEEGELIVADTADLDLKYIANISDPTKWTPMFIDAFAAYLASETVFSLKESNTAVELMKKLYAQKIEDASSSESQVGTPIEPRQDYWTAGRYTDE